MRHETCESKARGSCTRETESISPGAAISRLGAAALLLAMSFLAACSLGPLERRGKVRIWTVEPKPSIAEAASRLSGLSLEESQRGTPWERQVGAEGGPDLIYAELGREFAEAGAGGRLLELSGYLSKMGAVKGYWPGFKDAALDKALGGKCFLPATVYLWGLWYNKDILAKAGLSIPKSFAELESAFGSLAKGGILPLALGADSGWPALAWVSLLDMRYNGADSYARLLEGSRRLGDPGLLQPYAALARWRNQSWIDPEAAGKSWTEAFAMVEKGEAAFTLMSAYAASRARKPEALGFIPLPEKAPGTKRGELAVIEGFSVSKSCAAPEAALSLANEFIGSGAKSETGNTYLMPAVSSKAKKAKDASPVEHTEVLMLEGAKAILPQMDRFLKPAQANNVNRTMRDFFSKGSQMDPIGLSQAMKAAQDIQ